MCGIWALIPLAGQKTANAWFEDFYQLKHRGPDHTSFEVYRQVVLGFHRLAILDDRAAANQPFVLEEEAGTVLCMCNGEIYNWKELVEVYHLSAVQSDCRVIPEIYMQLKKADRLHEFYHVIKNEVQGEFAFVLFDFNAQKHLQKVVIARDEIGVRPLYYNPQGVEQGSLLFTSELKGALQYKGTITEFPPGHLQTYTLDVLGAVTLKDYDFSTVYTTHRYFDGDLSYFHKTLPAPEEKTTQELLRMVQKAVIASVERRLSADKPLAFLLSGGVDSSLVAALSARLLGRPIRTFCCGMQEGTDLLYARKVAAHIGSQHTEVFFTPEEGLAAIPAVIRTIESWDTTTVRASVGQYLVSKFIGTRTDCKVVMVGEGPDEVCSSYLFNWYAPTGAALDLAAKDYVAQIHYYDVKRADRCIAAWGLEGRVALLDPEFIKAYWTIPADQRMPTYQGMEKWWLREAFAHTGLLPDEVLWRKKEAFSDGISGEQSWYAMIQAWVEDQVTEEELAGAAARFPYCTPRTKEAYYYRRVFCEIFGEHRQEIIPGYWQPRWTAQGEVVTDYVDPSARVLGIYPTA